RLAPSLGQTLVVGEAGGLAEVTVREDRPMLRGEQPALARRVDEVPSPEVPVGRRDTNLILAEDHVRDPHTVPDLGAHLAGPITQHRVELRSVDVPRVALRPRQRLGEVEGLVAAGLLADELRAPLEEKDVRVGVDSQDVDQQRRRGQQRLADVEAWEFLLLEDEHAMPRLREQDCRRGAPGACPRDHDIEPLRTAAHSNPPSIWITCPVMYEALSLARKATRSATSSGRPRRLAGISCC